MATDSDIPFDLILGTAGHIDHGKTSLIRSLTGIETDRLPEEKKRGITIELGYAHLDLPPFRLGIVDVPGHEKFVRQMLAGATGMDLAMLIVAADDSVKQQTLEHLDILSLLGITSGIIVLTKVDLVDPDWLDLVEMEVRQLVEGTFFERAPIVRTSARSGKGLDELKGILEQECRQLIQADSPHATRMAAPFRLAIDRAFSIAGHGTVVTGSVLNGELRVGDQVEILPSRVPARVRGLQNHDQAVELIRAGQRAAINLAGVSLQEIERGHELSAPGFLKPVERMLVRVKVLERAAKPLKNRARVRFHIGTAELSATLRLFNVSELQPGESGLAQVNLSEPAVAVWNQPFVIRRPSPAETIGGGVVIHPDPIRLKTLSEVESELMAQLLSADSRERASAASYFCSGIDWTSEEWIRTAGVIDHQTVFEQAKHTGELIEVPLSSGRATGRTLVVHRLKVDGIAQRVLQVLERLHESHPLRFAHPRHEVAYAFAYLEHGQWLEIAIDRLKAEKLITANINSLSIVGSGPKLSKGQKQLMEQLIEQLKSAGLEAPTVAELQSAAAKNKDAVQELLALAAENGALARIADDFYLHGDTVDTITNLLKEALAEGKALTTSDLRQVLNTSRKYAIPILEYFDRIGLTSRNGDQRTLTQ